MLRCFAVSAGAVHNDSTVSVVGLEGQSKRWWCHEANDRRCDNGCELSGRFYSCNDQGFGCDRCVVVPKWFLSSLAVSVRLLQWAAVSH